MKDLKKYDREFLVGLLKQMILIRRFEEKASQLYGIRKIGGFLHLYIGQEAVATGALAALDLAEDYVLTAYRDHGHAIACRMDPGQLMAELYGKATGVSKGKGGSMHFFSKEQHMLGGNGIVGAHLPVATGVALKLKYKKEKGAVLVFFGDGAIHQGTFHESLNLARIWNLPIIYICENNQYGMGTDFRRVSSVHDFSVMAASYNIEGEQVDGMNVLSVYEAVKNSLVKAKEGNPAFLEIKTYRYKGHSASDPAKYRTKEELAAYKKSDPIIILKDELTDNSVIGEEDFTGFDAEAREIVEKAVLFAEESNDPPAEELYSDIYM